MSWAWSQIHIAAASEAASQEHHSAPSPMSVKRRRKNSTDQRQNQSLVNDGLSDTLIERRSSSGSSDRDVLASVFSSSQDSWDTSTNVGTFDLPQPTNAFKDDIPLQCGTFEVDGDHVGNLTDFVFDPLPPLMPNFMDPLQPWSGPGLDFNSSNQDTQPALSFLQREIFNQNNSVADVHEEGREPSTSQRQRKRRLSSPASAFSIEQRMISRSNNESISGNLLQIYHDVLEHNLSCWLTEKTCPYKTSGIPRGAKQEWGSEWSNRIYLRTLKLDRVARSARLTQVSSLEEKSAAKALRLSIMAFATQWAQGSQRQRERYPSASSQSSCCNGNMEQEFDRQLQHNLWEQAKRSLDDVCHVESYKVVCAELIFGLAQKPLGEEDVAKVTSKKDLSREGFDKDSLLAHVASLISQDGPPVYLERAARKIHVLRSQYETTITSNARSHHKKKAPSHARGLDDEDRGTISLLYWLAVMFDTVSSSMNERPVVVVDSECQHDGLANESEGEDHNQWKVDLFIQDSLERPRLSTKWPCSHEVAAEIVTKSAPVKVLLYRHISYLQRALKLGRPFKQGMDIIQHTLALYRYWNQTYGAFFKQLVHDFDSVPERIQSWFVCISAHWHLAVLMFADLVDFMAQESCGDSASTQKGLTNMASRVRDASTRELSDLARVATPPDEDSFLTKSTELPSFHHAVNEGTILTEPWTIILIRAFSKAAILLMAEVEKLKEAELLKTDYTNERFTDTLQHAESCVRSLWFLGKKSDMSRKVALVLRNELDRLRLRHCDFPFDLRI